MSDFHRYTRSYVDQHSDERESITQEHLGRIPLGKKEWNAWAEEFEQYIKNNKIEDAIIDFTGSVIESAEFEEYLFPCEVRFTRAKFKGNAGFSGAKFNGDADFSGAKFNGDADFSWAKFKGHVVFTGAKFNGDAGFSGAKFNGDADFSWAKFKGHVVFTGAKFKRDTEFAMAKFKGNAGFSGAKFNGDAGFTMAKFKRYASFTGAKFNGDAGFGGVAAHAVILEHTQFISKVPDFRYSTFEAASYLANMAIKPNKYFDSVRSEIDVELDVLRYRKLKEMAIASHDHQKELEFFAGEIKSKRGVETKYLSSVPGYLFGWFSNFGLSLWRPLVLITITIGLSWYFVTWFLIEDQSSFPREQVANSIQKWDCPDFDQNRNDLNNYSFRYVFRSSLPITVSSRAENEKIIRCLFNNVVPPFKYKVLAFIQLVFSLAGIFLFGLGLRNRFKIK